MGVLYVSKFHLSSEQPEAPPLWCINADQGAEWRDQPIKKEMQTGSESFRVAGYKMWLWGSF